MPCNICLCRTLEKSETPSINTIDDGCCELTFTHDITQKGGHKADPHSSLCAHTKMKCEETEIDQQICLVVK